MDTPHQYRHDGFSEGDPGNIDPNEINRKEPSKSISEIEALKINQSQLGRDQGQTPADEHIEYFDQIDSETRSARSASEHEQTMEQTLRKEFDTEDFRRVDERDNNDSTEDWDAERSRTGRQK